VSLTAAQVTQLLHPINKARVVKDGKGHAHVSQQDILAHLIRVFGFGNFDIEVLSTECVFEQPRKQAADGIPTSKFDVCYRALIRLTIRDSGGNELCHYENGSTATAQNQTRGDAHDLAYKSAISLSVKRAAIALGDQFGLSLYNKGQVSALVRGTLVTPVEPEAGADPVEDVQADVPQQLALGNDEVDHADDAVVPA
jgi:recombination DNA repair RAD52 pathway protein